MSSRSTDELLAEYLRVINQKDGEIHRLVAQVSGMELEARKKDEKHRARIREMQGEINALKSKTSSDHEGSKSSSSIIAQLRQERETLMEDVNRLREALQLQDSHIRALSTDRNHEKASEFATRKQFESDFQSKAKLLETEIRSIRDRNVALETMHQRTLQQLEASEKEATRWKTEAQRLQNECEKSNETIKVLRRREIDELVPKVTVIAEARQLEMRHNTLLGTLEKEVDRLREELRAESANAGRREASEVNFRRRVQDLESELARTSRIHQELEITLAQERLVHAQSIEELQQNSELKIGALGERVEVLSKERTDLKAEIATLQKRLQETEATGDTAVKRFQEDLNATERDLFTTRQSVYDLNSELNSQKNIGEQRGAYIKELQTKLETLQMESSAQLGRMKYEIEHAENLNTRQAAELKRSEAMCVDLRGQVGVLQSSLSNERTEAVQKEDRLQVKLQDLQMLTRAKDDEKRTFLQKLEDKIRDLEGKHQTTLQELQWKSSSELQAAKGENSILTDKNTELDRANQELREKLRLAERTRDELYQKEKGYVETQHDMEQKLIHTELELAQKEATVATLKRANEAANIALLQSQADVESLTNELRDERIVAARLDSQCAEVANQLKRTRSESVELADRASRVEVAAQQQQRELQGKLQTMAERLHNMTADLYAKDQIVGKTQQELQQLQQQHAEECSTLRHEVLSPLQQKVETLVNINRKLHDELTDRDAKLEEKETMRSKLNAVEDHNFQMQSELGARDRKEKAMGIELEALREKADKLRTVARELENDQTELQSLKRENESLSRKVKSNEAAMEGLTQELYDLRARDANYAATLASKKAELSTLQERLANADSLKAISEKNARETMARERDLQQQLEDLQAAHNTLQLCFQKQQEQLELGRRMREQDARVTSSHSQIRVTDASM